MATANHIPSYTDFYGVDGNKSAIIKKATQNELNAGEKRLADMGVNIVGKGVKETAKIMVNLTKEQFRVVNCTKNEKGELSKECSFETYKIASNSNGLTPPKKNNSEKTQLSNITQYEPNIKYYGDIKGTILIELTRKYIESDNNIEKITTSISQIGKLYEFLNNSDNDLGIGKDDFKQMLDFHMENGLDCSSLRDFDDIDTTEIEDEDLQKFFKKTFGKNKSEKLLDEIDRKDDIIIEENRKQEEENRKQEEENRKQEEENRKQEEAKKGQKEAKERSEGIEKVIKKLKTI